MNTSSLHVNLLKETEKLSSSPIRLRIMLPVVAFLACVGLAIWWSIIFTQLLMVQSSSRNVEEMLEARKKTHAAAVEDMNALRELRLEAEQLGFYSNGVRHVATPLARLAEEMPLKVQLTELSMPPPAPIDLTPPKGKKAKKGKKAQPLWGPTNETEAARLVFSGRTPKDQPLIQLMETLEEPDFRALVTKTKKVTSVRQDTVGEKGRRLLAFEVEYVMPERRFVP